MPEPVGGPGDVKRQPAEPDEKFQYVAIFAMAIGSIVAIVMFVKFIVVTITYGY